MTRQRDIWSVYFFREAFTALCESKDDFKIECFIATFYSLKFLHCVSVNKSPGLLLYLVPKLNCLSHIYPIFTFSISQCTHSYTILRPPPSARSLRMCHVITVLFSRSFMQSANRVKVFSVVTCSLCAKVRHDCLSASEEECGDSSAARSETAIETQARRRGRSSHADTSSAASSRVTTSAPPLSPTRQKPICLSPARVSTLGHLWDQIRGLASCSEGACEGFSPP